MADAEIIDHPLRFQQALYAAAIEAHTVPAPTAIVSQAQMDRLLDSINAAHQARLATVYAEGYRDGVRDGRKDQEAESDGDFEAAYIQGHAAGRASAWRDWRSLLFAANCLALVAVVVAGVTYGGF